MATTLVKEVASPARKRPVAPALRPGRVPYILSGALAVVAMASALLTFLLPDVLRGPAVMNGSARGTALVIVLIDIPVLVCAMLLARRGSARAVLTWLGATAVLAYNSLMFLFATPANRLFPLYLAMLTLCVWSIAAVVTHTDVRALALSFSPRAPVRSIAIYVWVIVALNATMWLSRILPALTHSGAPAYLRGTGLTTNVTFVQDLSLWLPLLAVAAAWLWQRRPAGYLIVGAGLVMWVIESACVAVDQWYGHAASPSSTVASLAVVPVFAALALLGLVPVYFLLRGFADTAAFHFPVASRRSWPAWTFTTIALVMAAGAVYGGTQLIRDGFGMPMNWLSHTPITGWTLPGLALLLGVALPQLASAALVAVTHRWALAASYLAGLALIAWIAVQLLVLQRYFFLQPVIAGLGLAEVLLAWLWHRQAQPRPEPRTGTVGEVRPGELSSAS